jgi:hypothetical protein
MFLPVFLEMIFYSQKVKGLNGLVSPGSVQRHSGRICTTQPKKSTYNQKVDSKIVGQRK